MYSASWILKKYINVDRFYHDISRLIFIFLVSLSTILETPIKIHKIRAGRASPGLKAQHLTGLSLGKPSIEKTIFCW